MEYLLRCKTPKTKNITQKTIEADNYYMVDGVRYLSRNDGVIIASITNADTEIFEMIKKL